MICTRAIIHKMEKWDCLSGCRNQCMLVREEERDTVGDTSIKYHGKWELRRMMFGGNKVGCYVSNIFLGLFLYKV